MLGGHEKMWPQAAVKPICLQRRHDSSQSILHVADEVDQVCVCFAFEGKTDADIPVVFAEGSWQL